MIKVFETEKNSHANYWTENGESGWTGWYTQDNLSLGNATYWVGEFDGAVGRTTYLYIHQDVSRPDTDPIVTFKEYDYVTITRPTNVGKLDAPGSVTEIGGCAEHKGPGAVEAGVMPKVGQAAWSGKEVIDIFAKNDDAAKDLQDFLRKRSNELFSRDKIVTYDPRDPAQKYDGWNAWIVKNNNGGHSIYLPKANTSALAASFLYHELMHSLGANEYEAYLKQAQFIASFLPEHPETFEQMLKALPEGFIPSIGFRFTGDGGENIWANIDKEAIKAHVDNMPYEVPWILMDDPTQSIKQNMLDAIQNYLKTQKPDTIKTK